MTVLDSGDLVADRLRRLELRLERERRARCEAERLLESKSLELYEANRALSGLAVDLEERVQQRTQELSVERQRALELAETDSLTKIANRASFERQLIDTLANRDITAEGVVLLLIDLDDFKIVNDTLGHAAGDALLVEIARRLVEAVRPQDVVARLGGDEFAVIAKGTGQQQAAQQMAYRLLKSLCRPVTLGGHGVPCNCSIGMALSEVASRGADDLLRNADLALYESKRAGGARVTSYEAAMRTDLERRAAFDAEVRQAIADDRIEPWYQPIMRTGVGHFVGAELLARWNLANGEIRSPATFLDTVQSLGLLDAMMESMLRRALRDAIPFIAEGTLEYLSINVSPVQFNQGWPVKRLPELLAEAGFPPHALVVEVVETALLDDNERTRERLDALNGSGMRLALDDFGVGYSNFSLLRQPRFALMKLDRTLTCDIETDDRALALVECFLELAARLEIKVVAEGVETRRQAELLAAAGCTGMQGYWVGRPNPDLAHWFGAAAARPPF